jgi:hypothetical protein
MAARRELRLRITLIAPPAGVVFSLQDKDGAPVDAVVADGGDLSFDLSIGVAPAEGGPRYLGGFVRTGDGGKFIYFASGGQAGQTDTEWSRRGKVMLAGLPAKLVASALETGARLEARFAGKARDGGPACARVEPVAAWAAVEG